MIWNLTKTEKDKAQITIYGPIQDFSSFFSSSGTSPQKVMQDLDELSRAKGITIRINSGGGSAFAGLAIFELIRAHGAAVTVRIDGVAASAASIIAMAGDKIVMGTGAMMMIHNPWTRAEGNAKELREAADMLDRVGESLVNVYTARTGKSRDELKAMLDQSTWMTADEAVANGFADEVDRKTKVAASIQGGFAVFNGQRFALDCFASLPDLPVLSDEAEPEPDAAVPDDSAPAALTPPPQKQTKESDDDLEIKNLRELRAKFPEFCNQIVTQAQADERSRLQAIDEIASTVPQAMVAKAKYEEPMTAQELALAALRADAAAGKTFTQARADELGKGSDNVPPAAPPSNEQEVEAAAIDKIAAFANQNQNRKGEVRG